MRDSMGVQAACLQLVPQLQHTALVTRALAALGAASRTEDTTGALFKKAHVLRCCVSDSPCGLTVLGFVSKLCPALTPSRTLHSRPAQAMQRTEAQWCCRAGAADGVQLGQAVMLPASPGARACHLQLDPVTEAS